MTLTKTEITTRERAKRLLDAIRYGSRKFPFQIWDDGEFCAEELIKTLDAIETIRDSDPDAHKAIMREMGDGR